MFLYSLFKSASALFYSTATCIAKTMPIFPLYFPCLPKATLLYPLSVFSFPFPTFSILHSKLPHIHKKSVTAFSAVTLALPQGLEPWTP